MNGDLRIQVVRLRNKFNFYRNFQEVLRDIERIGAKWTTKELKKLIPLLEQEERRLIKVCIDNKYYKMAQERKQK